MADYSRARRGESDGQGFPDKGERDEEDIRPRTISGQIDRLASLAQRMDEAVSVLEKTLEPVLAKQPTEAESGVGENAKSDWDNRSHFAELLENIADRYERRLRQIYNLTSKVDF